MTPWHRFWFPDEEASRHVQHDAALWSPNALTELHQSFWHQAAEATAHWWQFVSVAWPSLPLQQPPGRLQTPFEPDAGSPPPQAARRPPAAGKKARPTRKSATPPKRPRSATRGQ